MSAATPPEKPALFTFAQDVLDSKLEKNQSPVLFRLAGFRSPIEISLHLSENK
jgi:hypothetical protein